MAFPGIPQFPVGLGLQDGDKLNNFVHNTLSVDSNVRAHAGGGQQFATLIDAVVNVITRVTTVGDSVQLPPTEGRLGFGPTLVGVQLLLINSTSNACQVFANWFEPQATIGGISGSTGVSLNGGGSLTLVCGSPGTWISISGPAGGGLPLTGGQLTGELGFTSGSFVGAGTSSQATATLLTRQLSVVTSFPTSGVSGVRLPASADVLGSLGPIWLKNKDPNNNGLVWPPVGGQIDSFGVNQPVFIPSQTDINITPDATTGQWWL